MAFIEKKEPMNACDFEIGIRSCGSKYVCKSRDCGQYWYEETYDLA